MKNDVHGSLHPLPLLVNQYLVMFEMLHCLEVCCSIRSSL